MYHATATILYFVFINLKSYFCFLENLFRFFIKSTPPPTNYISNVKNNFNNSTKITADLKRKKKQKNKEQKKSPDICLLPVDVTMFLFQNFIYFFTNLFSRIFIIF